MKRIILLCIVGFQLAFSQEQAAVLDIKYSSTFSTNKESLAISNKQTNELVLFIEDYQKSHIYLLDDQNREKKHLEIASLPTAFKKYIGYEILGEKLYRIFFTNNSQKKFGALTIDFSNETTINQILDFKLKKRAI